MSDLVAGRYPILNPVWAMDGAPFPPYRTNMPDGLVGLSTGNGGATLTPTTGKMVVVPVACMPGDVITTINLLLGTAAGTQTHAWVALYTGIAAASTLIYQSTDQGSSAETAGAQAFALNSGATTPTSGNYLVGGNPGTPQNATTTGTASGQPVVLGVGICWTASTMPKWDGSLGASGITFKNQIAPVYTCGSALGATAPATLSGIAASNGPVPYVALTMGN